MKKELKNEIAHVSRDILHPVFMGLLANQDDTLATRGNGKGLKIYDDIERDCHAFAVLQKRKMAVIARNWCVEPASDSPTDKKAGDFVEAQLKTINFDKICLDLLDAILKGYAVSEIMWATDGANVTIDKVLPRNQRRFNFDIDYRLRLLTQQDMLQGELMPDRKFIVHSFGGKDGNPYGLGLGSRLFWPVFFKRQDITFWLTFADKFGSPTLIGKYPEGTPQEEQTDFINQLSSMAQDAAIAIPQNMALDLLEAARSGGADFFERMARYMDEQISVAVLGETMTTSGKSTGLGGNQSGTHNEVRLELVKADADLLSDTLNQTIVKWLVEFNVPGAKPPRVYREVEEEEDLHTRAERDSKIYAMGFKPTLAYINETYGEGWEESTQNNVLNTVKPVLHENDNIRNASFAESDLFPDQQALDAAINAIDSEAVDASMMALMKPLIDAIEYSEPGKVLEALAEKYPDMDSTKLEDALARAYFVSEVWGRLNA